MELISELADRTCQPCKGVPSMSKEKVEAYLTKLPGWRLDGDRIEKDYEFKDYITGLDFANRVGRLAEQQDHHPEILIRWRHVSITFTTHSIKGLSENDFIMAAKAEREYARSIAKLPP